MNYIKNDKGFTLMEMVIALGIVGMVGVLLISSIASTNANTKVADTINFMDSITTQARNVFDAYPQDVIDGVVTEYPYGDMAYQRISINDLSYRQSFNEKKFKTQVGMADEYYRLVIKLTGVDKAATTGFSFITKTYNMEAMLFEKINGVFTSEPIYTRTYVFDSVTIRDLPASTETNKITFQGNGGCIVENATSTTCIANTVEKDYYKGDSLFSSGVDGNSMPAGYKENAIFIGWSLGPDDRNLLTNEFRVSEDKDVYAQYLKSEADDKEYRVEFRISASERFNVNGVEGEAATKPYFIEKSFSTPTVTIGEIGSNVSDFFEPNAVRKQGYQFKYWMDAQGNLVNLTTIMADQYTVLYPYFEESVEVPEELAVQFTLDLNGVVAGMNEQDKTQNRLFALYSFTKMEYSLKYEASDDSFTLVQKEIFNDNYGSVNAIIGMSGGDIMTTRQYNTKNHDFFKMNVDGRTYTTFSEYVRGERIDPDSALTINDIQLKVNIPRFELSDYFSRGLPQEALMSNGSTLSRTELEYLLLHNKANEIVFKSNKPMSDEVSIENFNKKITELSNGGASLGEFSNVGSAKLGDSGTVSYHSYMKTETLPDRTVETVDRRFREIDYTVVIPFSMIGNTLSGVAVSDIRTFVRDGDYENGTIMIGFKVKYTKSGNYAVSNKGETVLDTGIRYKEKQANGVFDQYSRIKSLKFTIDAELRYPWDRLNDIGNVEVNEAHPHMAQLDYGGILMKVEHWYPDEAFSGASSGQTSSPFRKSANSTSFTVRANHKKDYGLLNVSAAANSGDARFRSCRPPKMSAPAQLILATCFNYLPAHEVYSTYISETYIQIIPGGTVEKEVLSFSKNKTQNYLPHFLKNTPY